MKGYELPGSAAPRKHPLVQALLNIVMANEHLHVVSHPGKLHPLPIKTAEEMVDFSRDVFLRLMEDTGEREDASKSNQWS